MATFVLVHGAWCGGWIWQDVAPLLRAAGHEPYTPTLTGLGERVHLAHPDVGLDLHIQDIVMTLSYEDLHDIVLVGHSYGGMVITGVAEQVPERIARLVYLDAFVPRDGQSLVDLLGAELAGYLSGAAQEQGEGWRVPCLVTPEARNTPQPLKTALQPVSVKNPAAAALPRTFIFCTGDKADFGPLVKPIQQAAERAKADSRWDYRELATGHTPDKTAPRELADLLLELV